jgi:hypothetical protein
MILSVSRRTDIPAFYSKWFINRIHEGFVDVRNPVNIHQISRVDIEPDVVDCIVFWTKHAKPLMNELEELEDYKYYFQYTINPYDALIEKNVPRKNIIIDNFKELSDKIGPNRVIWRYDPILITNTINLDYHIKYFEQLAKRLSGFTDICVISFVDLYKKTVRNTQSLNMREPTMEEMHRFAHMMTEIAGLHNIKIVSCSEKENLEAEGIEHGCCIDRNLIEEITGYEIDATKDKNQRKECGCIQSIDIGAYNTCKHNCKYCYANFNPEKVDLQSKLHDPLSSLLIGEIMPDDKIRNRDVKLLKRNDLFG